MSVVTGIRGEFLRYKALAERAIEQLEAEQLAVAPPGGGNAIATICWHIAGNLRSRFTDFLTADGEKPWRTRDEEFEAREVTHAVLRDKWESGWAALLSALDGLTDADIDRAVTIRGQSLTVLEALLRALAHVASHCGQIVYAAKMLKGEGWTYLSIPPGQSDAYNRNPTRDKPQT